DRLAGLLQFMSDAAVVWWASRAVVVKYFKGHEELANGGDLGVIVAAVVGPEFQLRYRDGRQPDHVALRLRLPAARDQGRRPVTARALPSRGLETAQHENDRVGVQHVKHGDQSRDSSGGCTRLPLMN